LIPVVISILSLLFKNKEEPRRDPRARPGPEGGAGPPRPPRRSVSDIDQFLEEINRRRREAAERRPPGSPRGARPPAPRPPPPPRRAHPPAPPPPPAPEPRKAAPAPAARSPAGARAGRRRRDGPPADPGLGGNPGGRKTLHPGNPGPFTRGHQAQGG